MGMFDSLLGLLGGVGGALGGLGGLGNYSQMDSLTGMPPGYWQQYAKSLGMDEEEIGAFMTDLATGNLNATNRLNNRRALHFYENVCGNVADQYNKATLLPQLRGELQNAGRAVPAGTCSQESLMG